MSTNRTRPVSTIAAVSLLVMAACTSSATVSPTSPSKSASVAPSPSQVAIASPTNAPTPTSAPTAMPPSAEPSNSGVLTLGASGSGSFGAGTYKTAFQPALTFTLADQTIVDADGTVAYESIGETDVNEAGWISIGFGFDKAGPHGHGTWSADFFATRVDKVVDPRHPGTLIDPPKDLASWVKNLHGLTLTAPPASVKIGGLDATRLDIAGRDKGATIGPIPGITEPPAFGFGPHQSARIVVVNVDGHAVLITIGADSPAHFERAVAALQPLVDSIVWH